jgi:hypothetical protein
MSHTRRVFARIPYGEHHALGSWSPHSRLGAAAGNVSTIGFGTCGITLQALQQLQILLASNLSIK